MCRSENTTQLAGLSKAGSEGGLPNCTALLFCLAAVCFSAAAKVVLPMACIASSSDVLRSAVVSRFRLRAPVLVFVAKHTFACRAAIFWQVCISLMLLHLMAGCVWEAKEAPCLVIATSLFCSHVKVYTKEAAEKVGSLRSAVRTPCVGSSTVPSSLRLYCSRHWITERFQRYTAPLFVTSLCHWPNALGYELIMTAWYSLDALSNVLASSRAVTRWHSLVVAGSDVTNPDTAKRRDTPSSIAPKRPI